MVLVRVDVPLRPKNQSVANDEQSTESSSAKAPLPRAAIGSSLPIEPLVEPDAVSSPQATASQESLPPYHSQLKLLEQQNKKRLLMVRQEMAEREQSQDNGNKRASIDSNAASREDFYMQQMVLEQENGKRLIGARHQLAGQAPGANDSRNQGHDAQAIAGIYQATDSVPFMKHPLMPEERHQRQFRVAEQLRTPVLAPQGSLADSSDPNAISAADSEANWGSDKAMIQYQLADYGVENALYEHERARRLMHQSMEEDAAQQSTALQPASYNQVDDKWGKGPFPAGQGVIAGYQAQLAFLETERRETAAERSQAEAEMFILYGRLPPGATGSSCAPPEPHPAYM